MNRGCTTRAFISRLIRRTICFSYNVYAETYFAERYYATPELPELACPFDRGVDGGDDTA